MLKKNKKDGFIIGAALFSMFFGAGNMIFPPFLGFKSGTDWLIAFLCYFIADIGLAILTVFALLKADEAEDLFSALGTKLAKLVLLCVVLCIGPIICIPRTSATTFELSVLPLFPNFPVIPFTIVFFLLTFLMCVKKSAVVDIVGKILTPLLFFGLLAMIAASLLFPLGEIIEPRTASAVAEGVEAGYQSMDVLAAILFGALIVSSAKERGHTDEKSVKSTVMIAALVAGAGLLLVYIGLTYLGATASSLYNMHIGRTELLSNIIEQLFPGKSGLWFFAIVAGLACLSTSVALTGSAATYINKLSNGKLKYTHLVIVICLFSTVAACVGVEELVNIASPLLSILYPPILVLVLMKLGNKYFSKSGMRISAALAFIAGFLQMLIPFGISFPLFNKLPLATMNLHWVVPVLIVCAIDFIVNKYFKNTES